MEIYIDGEPITYLIEQEEDTIARQRDIIKECIAQLYKCQRTINCCQQTIEVLRYEQETRG